jgi:hypothetical protein
MKCYKRNVKLFIIIKKLKFIKEIVRSYKINKENDERITVNVVKRM